MPCFQIDLKENSSAIYTGFYLRPRQDKTMAWQDNSKARQQQGKTTARQQQDT